MLMDGLSRDGWVFLSWGNWGYGFTYDTIEAPHGIFSLFSLYLLGIPTSYVGQFWIFPVFSDERWNKDFYSTVEVVIYTPL